MQKKFKVMGDSKNTFMNIEIDLIIEDEKIGAPVNVLGGSFHITQNGAILVLVDKEWCLTLMDITPEAVKEKAKLTINENLEIYFSTKEVKVDIDCTYLELFNTLSTEWVMAGKLVGEPLPFEYNKELKLFTFKNGWGLHDGSMRHLSEGSFARKSEDGRNI